ncbi:hypothetical protein AV530_014192 [Patagioenas fasciata monilis]|uniref:Uncharacterized protein n=1 Tax=Patagioenas fasciata monilis TaxID=372326 RepID=A0A1V4J2E4_PATFA|nr:hypothetical protein AV530_014192 [Patagioenas fasciata monilis]
MVFVLPLITPALDSGCPCQTGMRKMGKLVFSFNDKLFGLLVKDMEAMDPSILKGESGASKKQKIEVGLVLGNSQVAFEKAENSSLNLIGKCQCKSDESTMEIGN